MQFRTSNFFDSYGVIIIWPFPDNIFKTAEVTICLVRYEISYSVTQRERELRQREGSACKD